MMALWAETGSLLRVEGVCVGCDCAMDENKIYFCVYILTGMSNVKIQKDSTRMCWLKCDMIFPIRASAVSVKVLNHAVLYSILL
jgi:hypothetical protein